MYILSYFQSLPGRAQTYVPPGNPLDVYAHLGIIAMSLSQFPGVGMAPGTTSANDTVTGGITAGAAQGSVVLTSQMNVVTTVATGNGVTLPLAAAGLHCLARNSSANPMSVWPPVGGQINALTVNTAVSVAANTTGNFESDGVQWYTVP